MPPEKQVWISVAGHTGGEVPSKATPPMQEEPDVPHPHPTPHTKHTSHAGQEPLQRLALTPWGVGV